MKVLQNTGLILLAASLAAATCFKGQGTIQVARDNIPVVCAQLQGQYNPQLGRDACVTDNSNHDHWYFLVKNTNNKNWATVALKDCTDGLMQEIDKCGQKGGKHTSNGIYFEYALFIPIYNFNWLTTT
jgi:hypothetical protein